MNLVSFRDFLILKISLIFWILMSILPRGKFLVRGILLHNAWWHLLHKPINAHTYTCSHTKMYFNKILLPTFTILNYVSLKSRTSFFNKTPIRERNGLAHWKSHHSFLGTNTGYFTTAWTFCLQGIQWLLVSIGTALMCSITHTHVIL